MTFAVYPASSKLRRHMNGREEVQVHSIDQIPYVINPSRPFLSILADRLKEVLQCQQQMEPSSLSQSIEIAEMLICVLRIALHAMDEADEF